MILLEIYYIYSKLSVVEALGLMPLVTYCSHVELGIIEDLEPCYLC